jgi:hypothetical protein
MERQEISMVFNMLPTSVQCRIRPFKSLGRSVSLSILPSWRHSAGEGVADFTVAQINDNQVGTSVEGLVRMDMERRQETLLASGVRWRYAEQGRVFFPLFSPTSQMQKRRVTSLAN